MKTLKNIMNDILLKEEVILSEMDLGQWNNFQAKVGEAVAVKKRIKDINKLFMDTNFADVFAKIVDRNDKMPTTLGDIVKKIISALKYI